ncbi:APC family permease [Desulfogranum marinum]|uniref:APC family permease n=1 Tax=Desulfogranum marinum TaxID=453220 RepID=UPI0019636FD6|nr:APC family permease [Desulfogranum marinum]MBM9513831.1 APC family permease [Desulfogranum marinum]
MGKKTKTARLAQLPATAICGNDISSSVLYVSALSIIAAGRYAWVALLLVAGVLHLFRKIYGEVVGALPLNGGAYNALLNTTSKSIASLAATLTLLSYMATAVISASEAMHYLSGIIPSLPVIAATIFLLALFLGITVMGIGESSIVAQIIFIFHLVSLILLSGSIIIYLFSNGLHIFYSNNQLPLPHNGSIGMAIFWGFAAAMLGISGFESSANFVENQQDGVFPKTLRNMWFVVSVFNPLMAFLALAIIPIPEVSIYETNLLSHMGQISGGDWLAALISIDAVVVLSGAVLTSYIGVTGLLERMTLDRILPGYLLKKNKHGSSYRISLMFFLLSVSILLITEGKVETLAGVYTISFLLVMGLFGVGNILLKIKREKLPRPERASWLSVIVAILAVACALWGNIIKEPLPGETSNLNIFTEYFFPTIVFVAIMLNRTVLLDILMRFIEYLFIPILKLLTNTKQKIRLTIEKIESQEFVFFTRGDNLANLNKVLLYIQKNEHTKKIKIVNVHTNGENEIAEKLERDIEFLDRQYPEIDIKLIKLKGVFGPELIQQLSKEWAIPVNFMFIGSPGDHFPYRVEELGGVRLII